MRCHANVLCHACSCNSGAAGAGGTKFPAVYCSTCADARLQSLREEARRESSKADEARHRLSEFIESRKEAWRAQNHSKVLKRVEALHSTCAVLRDEIFEERIDVADLQYGLMQKELKLRDAWFQLEYKRRELITLVLQPLVCCLRKELTFTLDELADARRDKVLQAIQVLGVTCMDDSTALVQGMPLPRFLPSLSRGGATLECVALTQLARLVVIIARCLEVPLPFAIGFRPNGCILWGGRDGREEVALTPPSALRPTNSLFGLSLHTATGGGVGGGGGGGGGVGPLTGGAAEDEWMRTYRRALHLLSLNVRHLLRTQLRCATSSAFSSGECCLPRYACIISR